MIGLCGGIEKMYKNDYMKYRVIYRPLNEKTQYTELYALKSSPGIYNKIRKKMVREYGDLVYLKINSIILIIEETVWRRHKGVTIRTTKRERDLREFYDKHKMIGGE